MIIVYFKYFRNDVGTFMSNLSKTYLQFVNSSLGLTDEENSELGYFPLPMYSYAIPRNEK